MIAESLEAQHGSALMAQRLTPLMRAVEVFGFHLATVDLRQSSDQHELVVAELLATAGVEKHYVKLNEAQRVEALNKLLHDARPLRVMGANYSELALKELAIFETAREMLETFGKDAIRHYIISHTEEVSDLLEVLLLQKECGLLVGTLDEGATGALIVSPAEEHPMDPHDAWADDMVLAEGLARYEEMVTEPVTRLISNWAGLRTFSPDRSLVIGRDSAEPSFFWLAGQGGYGFQSSPAASQLAADLVTGAAPTLSESLIAALSPARFG